MKLEEVVICIGCVSIDTILSESTLKEITKEKKYCRFRDSLSTFNEMEKQEITLRFLSTSYVSAL
jgi:hypothetical protein